MCVRHVAAMLGCVALRCLIVDDSPDFLDAARSLLEREAVAVVGVASTLAGALMSVAELRPDVVLVDIALGDESGLELTRRLGGVPPVILISTHAEADFVDLVGESPALGFISKADLSRQAIHDLLSGHSS
jgi:DNA-binding NarL/FixJ family response regulator